MGPEQERLKNLLTDTVTLLCKNGLKYQSHLRVEGLLAVSVDNSEVFFVHISETTGEIVTPETQEKPAEPEHNKLSSSSSKYDDVKDVSSSDNMNSNDNDNCSNDNSYDFKPLCDVKIKQEKEDIIIIKEEIDTDDSYEDCSSSINATQTHNSKHRYHPYPQFSNISMNQSNSLTYDNSHKDSSSFSSNRKHSNSMNNLFSSDKHSNNMNNMFSSDNNQTPNFPSTSAGSDQSFDAANWASQDLSEIASADPMLWSDGQNASLMDLLLPKRRRTDGPKKYQCSYPECARAFMHGRNLWRHEVLDHGRRTKKQEYGQDYFC